MPTPPLTPGVRVGLVDDDDCFRTARAESLARCPGIEVALAEDHAAAGARTRWDLDVVVVDTRGTSTATVLGIRRHRTVDQTRILVLASHEIDAVRLRMAAAGADALYPHASVATAEALAAALRAAVAGGDTVSGPAAVAPRPGGAWWRR